jgi:AbrB family looped-hinge helix DNA binding protein
MDNSTFDRCQWIRLPSVFAQPGCIGLLSKLPLSSPPPRRSSNLLSIDSWQVRRYLTYMKTKVSSKGQIVLPAELREQDHILPGQQFEVERLEAGQYLLKRKPANQNEGVVDWLLACPVKGWFVPIPSESTDTISTDIY